jgi:hypothetical protein
MANSRIRNARDLNFVNGNGRFSELVRVSHHNSSPKAFLPFKNFSGPKIFNYWHVD